MLELRKARTADLSTLLLWDQQPHVIASDPNDDWNWEQELAKEPAWRQQLMAELDGRAIGFIQIINPALEETHYWGEMSGGYRAIDIWIGMEQDLGRGYGTQMMQQALELCFEDPTVHTVLIDPLAQNTRAIRFYERLGFEFLEERDFGEDHCRIYAITRSKWENT